MAKGSTIYITGNEFVALPEIRSGDASLASFTFLHMGLKGMVVVGGEEGAPLMRPVVLDADGGEIAFSVVEWTRGCFWIPSFRAELEGGAGTLRGTILAPVGERGFAIRLDVEAGEGAARRPSSVGLRGRAASALHRVNESKPLGRGFGARPSAWNGAFCVDLESDLPVFSFAPMPEAGTRARWEAAEGKVDYELSADLADGGGAATFWWGLAFEEVGAVTSAKELQRKGWDRVLGDTLAWLDARKRSVGDPVLDGTLNLNLFFNFFFAAGMTLDTEEFVLATSRSPRYYVSAAYWDRDSLLWSLPSILQVDPDRALAMLEYAFGRQGRNFGVHSRYIDGTVLEPGFELDELVAPVLALDAYARATGDYAAAEREPFASGLGRVLAVLETKYHRDIGLYETFLQPTDDPAPLPFVTYDNVLAWKALGRLADFRRRSGRAAEAAALEARAAALREAILAKCVVGGGADRAFAWAVDGRGASVVYDEPPGSLELLAWHGFVSADDPVYRATVARVRDPGYRFSFAGRNVDEIGCEHAPHPWILSLANSLLCGRTEKARRILASIPMDGGVACESVDADSGEVATGAAFATCAGFLAYAILEAFGGAR